VQQGVYISAKSSTQSHPSALLRMYCESVLSDHRCLSDCMPFRLLVLYMSIWPLATSLTIASSAERHSPSRTPRTWRLFIQVI
jgi:hypothetical protein